jgi:sporulation-control protein spo0M
VFVESIENPDSHLANWITLNTSSFTIQPRSNLDIPFNITIPNNATP